jgi:hypothetical protein
MTQLAYGADPDTGEATLLSRNVTNALWRIIELVTHHEESRARAITPNCGKSWSRAEEAQVCSEFERGMPFSKMAELHGRTRGAIVSRLEQLGKIKDLYGFHAGHSSPRSQT